jgi:hypothetical protein
MVVYTRFIGGTGTPTGWTVNGQSANVYFGPHGSGASGLVQRAVCYIQSNGAFGQAPSVLINIENFS